jgi:hypothetical protein
MISKEHHSPPSSKRDHPGSKGVIPSDEEMFTLEQEEVSPKKPPEKARPHRAPPSDEHTHATSNINQGSPKREGKAWDQPLNTKKHTSRN